MLSVVGDIFLAQFLISTLRKLPIEERLKISCLAASAKCKIMGTSTVSRTEVEKILGETNEN